MDELRDASMVEINPAGKPAFTPPKLTFVKPKLEPQGNFEQVTAGFFGTFTTL